MKTTRRGLLGWLGALTGAAAASRVAPTAPLPLDNVKLHEEHRRAMEAVLRRGPLSQAIRQAGSALRAEMASAGNQPQAARRTVTHDVYTHPLPIGAAKHTMLLTDITPRTAAGRSDLASRLAPLTNAEDVLKLLRGDEDWS